MPTTEDDHNCYYHLRFGLEGNVNPDDFLDVLPDYCKMITPRRVTNSRILGINPSILKNDRYEEAWKVLGEQSEWIINV